MIALIYFGIGLTLGLWASKKVYRATLKDATTEYHPIPDTFEVGFACFTGIACIIICTLVWPVVVLALVLRRFLWNSTSSTSPTR